MGAVLWGMSLVGPQIDVARAEGDGSSSSSADSSSDAGASKTDAGPRKSAVGESGDAAKNASASDAEATETKAEDAGSSSDTEGSETEDSEPADVEAEDTPSDDRAELEDIEIDDADVEDADDTELDDTEPGDADTDTAAPGDASSSPRAQQVANLVTGSVDDAQPAALSTVVEEQDSTAVVAASPTAGDPWGMEQVANTGNQWQANTSAIIAATTSNMQLAITSLPVPPQLRDALVGTLWTMRRTFFNLAPTMNESYAVTSGLGTVVGVAMATDPEGDEIRYRVVKGPQYGTLTLNADGSYTYTPAAEFDGVDTFVIAATDLGMHVNLLEPFRAPGSSARMLVNQNAIDFDFTYNDPNGYFTAEAKAALYQSAKRLSVYFLVNQKTVLTYTVKSEYIEDGYLAAAGSGLSSTDPGFWRSVVQEKLLSGVDTNGAQADGAIDWNWAYDWGFYPAVGGDQYDFTSTVMHELLHSFGFIAGFDYPGDTEDTAWYSYAQFVTTREQDSPINSATYLWNSEYDPYLVGYDGGMFFSGVNAMSAYGGRPVPLYTPTTWSGGSSISHLDDDVFSGPNHVMMDHAAAGMGPDNIALSPVELGILMDLGYTVAPAPWFAYPPAARSLTAL